MKKVKVNEMREPLAEYLSDAEKGEEIVITKHSRPAARLVPLEPSSPAFPDLNDHRKSINVKNSPLSKTVIDQRKEERY